MESKGTASRKIALFLGGTIGVFVFVRFILGFNGLYGQDSHEYLYYARIIRAFFMGTPLEYDFFWPINYPLYGSVLSYISPSLSFALQLVSLGAHLGVALCLLKLFPVGKSADTTKVYFVVFMYFMAPQALLSGIQIMSDSLAACLVIWTFYFIKRLQAKVQLPLLIGLCFCASSAVVTRYPAAVILILPALYAVYLLIKQSKWKYILFGILICGGILFPFWVMQGGESKDFLGHHLLTNWSVRHFFMRSFQNAEGIIHYSFPNILSLQSVYLHPRYLFLGAILLPFIRKQDFQTPLIRLLIGSSLIYMVFLAGIPFQNPRFLLLIFPLILVLLFPAFHRLLHGITQFTGQLRIQPLIWIGIFIVQLSLSAYMFRGFYQLNQFEKKIATQLESYPPNRLYTFYVDLALRSYESPHDIVNLWYKRLQTPQAGERVLFHPTQFTEQWQGSILMENWDKLQQESHLVPIDTFDRGWILYEIQ